MVREATLNIPLTLRCNPNILDLMGTTRHTLILLIAKMTETMSFCKKQHFGQLILLPLSYGLYNFLLFGY